MTSWTRLSLTTVLLLAPAAAQQPPLIDRELFFGDPEISGAQISPDGKYIAFLKPLNKTRNIWVKKTDAPFDSARPITNDTKRPIPGYLWSRDGKYVLYAQDKLGDENYNVYAVDPAAVPAAPAEVPTIRSTTWVTPKVSSAADMAAEMTPRIPPPSTTIERTAPSSLQPSRSRLAIRSSTPKSPPPLLPGPSRAHASGVIWATPVGAPAPAAGMPRNFGAMYLSQRDSGASGKTARCQLVARVIRASSCDSPQCPSVDRQVVVGSRMRTQSPPPA